MRLGPIPAAALLFACTASPPAAGPQQAAELVGRRAGEPQRCVAIRPGETFRILSSDRHTLVYGSGRTIWLNHLGSCGFRDGDVLLTSTSSSFYCRGEIIRSFSSTNRIPGPTCILGDFVPYSR